MDYKTLRYYVTVNLTHMAYYAALELEHEGYVKVVTGNKGSKFYFKPTEIDTEPLIDIYADSIMKDTVKTYKFDERYHTSIYNSRKASEIVSKYITVETLKKDIKNLQGRIEE